MFAPGLLPWEWAAQGAPLPAVVPVPLWALCVRLEGLGISTSK